MKIAIVDYRLSEECRHALSEEGFHVMKTEADNRLSPAISGHADMLFCSIGGALVTTRGYFEAHRGFFERLRAALPSLELITTCDNVSKTYPHDAKMNLLFTGDKVYANTATASVEALALAEAIGCSLVKVKQGYPACTSLIASSTAITADRGMARVFSREGLNVCLIKDGGILLPPYEYGFIGGTCGIFRDKIYFCGALEYHPDGEKIAAACRDAGFTPISLGTGALLDVGGILFLEEDVDEYRKHRDKKQAENAEERIPDI